MAAIDKKRLPVSLVDAGSVAAEATEKVDEPDRPVAEKTKKYGVLARRYTVEPGGAERISTRALRIAFSIASSA